MKGEPPVEETTCALRAAGSLTEVRGTIRARAPQFHEAVNQRVETGERPDLGIDMSVVPGPKGSGLVSKIGDSFFVSIGGQGRSSERRFALAHELGHVLLDAVDPSRVHLDAEQEEELCELFARRAVAPPAKVHDHFNRVGFPADLAGVERFARQFGLSWRATLVVLDDFFPVHWPVAFVAASWRGHPSRPRVLGLRVDASAADSRVLFPRNCRLGTLEFCALEAWLHRAALGEEATGGDTEVRVRSGVRGVSAWLGESRWTARLHRAPNANANSSLRGMVCAIDVSKLVPIRTQRRRAEPSPIQEIPGQLGLAAR